MVKKKYFTSKKGSLEKRTKSSKNVKPAKAAQADPTALSSKKKTKKKVPQEITISPNLLKKVFKFLIGGVFIVSILGCVSYVASQTQVFFQNNERLIAEGNYDQALGNYSQLAQKLPLWFIKDKVSFIESLIESSENYEKGIQYFEQEDYEQAKECLKKVLKDDIHFSQAQEKLTEIAYLETFKTAEEEITKENREGGTGDEKVEIPERDSLFEEREEESTSDSAEDSETQDSETQSESSGQESTDQEESVSGRRLGIQFFDCSNASSADYDQVNEAQVNTFYSVLDHLLFPESLLKNAVVVFNTEVNVISVQSSHKVTVDGQEYEFPLLDPDQYKYSTSWIKNDRVFLNLDYKYSGNDLEAILSYELAHVLEDSGMVLNGQMKEWINLRGIDKELLTDWNKTSETIEDWEASPREDFAECYKYILGNNKGGDLWKIRTQYGDPSVEAQNWMKDFQKLIKE